MGRTRARGRAACGLATVFVTAALVVAGVPRLHAQGSDAAAAAMRAANAMYEAFRAGQLDRFVSYTYPGLVTKLGGTEHMIDLLEKGRADMAAQGVRFEFGVAGQPRQIVRAGTELHALVPLRQVMAAPGGELHINGYLLGISGDAGRTWTFIDTERLTPENVREVVPNFNPQLSLPRRSAPLFVPR